MPIIRDPVHNQLQGQYGVVYCEHLPGGGDGLAVYDKSTDSTNNIRHLPTGWKVAGNVSPLNNPFIWCGVPINFIIDIRNQNAGGHGPVSAFEEVCLRGHDQWIQPLTPPRTGNVIYPL